MKTDRLISLDVLKVISMFFVVVGHYVYHGVRPRPELIAEYSFDSIMGNINFFTMETTYLISCTAVNCFVMISGYFLINKTSFRWNGINNVWFRTVFYSFIFCILGLLNNDHFSFKIAVTSLFPIYNYQYWFITFYLGLMLLAPFLSKVALQLNQKQYILFLLVLFIMNFQYLYGPIYGGFATIMWFSFIYLVAGYIRIFGVPEWVIKNKVILLFSVWGILLFITYIYNLLQTNNRFITTSSEGPIFFLSLVLFINFVYSDFRGKFMTFLSKLAPYTLGVYLIHENHFLVDSLWNFCIPGEYNYPMLIHCLITCIGIFVACILLDFIRKLLFQFFKIDSLINRLSTYLPQL